MSTETVSRKATFKQSEKGLEAVNKRAKIVVRKAGKRKYITKSELKAFVGKGTYRFYLYTKAKKANGQPVLQPIKF